MGIVKKLNDIQSELKAPKNQFNSFGKYHYRSCEDILEAVKPLTKKYKTALVISDEIVCMGDRFYIKATAKLLDQESEESVEAYGYARESLDKKGMDASQVTGATSSYARKYSLNGLFNIDDTKDTDTDEFYKSTNRTTSTQKTQNTSKNTGTCVPDIVKCVTEMDKLGIDFRYKYKEQILTRANVKSLQFENLTDEENQRLLDTYKNLITAFKKQKGE